MHVHNGVKTRCQKCKLVRRKGILRCICEIRRHNQRQG